MRTFGSRRGERWQLPGIKSEVSNLSYRLGLYHWVTTPLSPPALTVLRVYDGCSSVVGALAAEAYLGFDSRAVTSFCNSSYHRNCLVFLQYSWSEMLQFRPVVAAHLYCNLLRSNHFQIFLVRVSRHPVLSRNYWFHQFLSNVSHCSTYSCASYQFSSSCSQQSTSLSVFPDHRLDGGRQYCRLAILLRYISRRTIRSRLQCFPDYNVFQTVKSHSQTMRSHFQTVRSHSQTARSHSQTVRSHFQTVRSHSQTARSHSQTMRSQPRDAISYHVFCNVYMHHLHVQEGIFTQLIMALTNWKKL